MSMWSVIHQCQGFIFPIQFGLDIWRKSFNFLYTWCCLLCWVVTYQTRTGTEYNDMPSLSHFSVLHSASSSIFFSLQSCLFTSPETICNSISFPSHFFFSSLFLKTVSAPVCLSLLSYFVTERKKAISAFVSQQLGGNCYLSLRAHITATGLLQLCYVMQFLKKSRPYWFFLH